jgi:hypothetical protein
VAAEATLPQRLVVYRGDQGEATVFETAYTSEQVERALLRCRSRYGAKANCRSMSAKDHRKEWG